MDALPGSTGGLSLETEYEYVRILLRVHACTKIYSPILPPTRDEIPLKWGKIPPSGTREREKIPPKGRREEKKILIISHFFISILRKNVLLRKYFNRKYFL